MRTRRRERGALLGIVMVLIAVLLAASVFAFFALRSDMGASQHDRLSRQLFDCAEQGLAMGKTFFSQPSNRNWDLYLNSSNLCASLPCPPFPTGGAGTPPANYPFNKTVSQQMGQPANGTAQQTINFDQWVGIYNNPNDVGGSPLHNVDTQIIVYSVCKELSSGTSRTVQALLNVPVQSNSDYFGQGGLSFRNNGNSNGTQ